MRNIELEYKILSKLKENPNLTQRQMAEELGLSLGKTNYLIRALIDRGLVKLKNFSSSDEKINYMYLLTLSGMTEKAKLARKFLQYKSDEFTKLKKEIENLKSELALDEELENE